MNCDNCGLGAINRNRRKQHWIMGDGNTEKGIMFVTDIISGQDAMMGVTLSGPTGMLLTECIKKAGYTRNDVYTTSLLKCAIDKKRNPKPEEVQACKDYLEEEILKMKPKVIVPLGAIATKYFLGNKKISDVRGYIFDNERKGISIIPTYSPGAIIQRPNNLFELQKDVDKAFDVLKNGNKQIKRTYKFTKDFEQVYNLLKQYEEFAFDLETTGLNTFKDSILTCSFSFKEGSAICIPFDKEWYIKIFSLPNKKIAHTKFDCKFLKDRYGIETNNWYFDTYAAIALLNDNVGFALKTLASVYTDVPYYNLDTKVGLENIDIKEVALYNNFDADVTFRLYKIFYDWLIRDRYYTLFFDTVMPVNRMLMDIEHEGINIDIDALKKLSIEKNIECVNIKKKLNDIAPINWNSPKQVGETLYGTLGLVCPEKTPTGAPSTNVKVLNQLDHKAPKMLLELRHLNKGIGTYLTGLIENKEKPPKTLEKEKHYKWNLIKTEIELIEYLEDLDSYIPDYSSDLFSLLQDDNKIHNTNNINGTVSGRLTSPLHTIPREGGYREIFIAPPNYKFVGMDYKQFELRIAAYLAGEKSLLEILDSPGVKQVLTKLIIDLDYNETIWSQVKGVIYGTLYGRGPRSIAQEFGISDAFAEELRDSFFKNFTRVKKLLKTFKTKALEHCYIDDMVGRKRRFITKNYSLFDIDGDIVRQAINFPIQAGSAAIFWPKVLEVNNYLKDFKSSIIHTKHDAVYFKIHNDEEHLILECKDILEKNTLVGDVLMDVKIGRNWGEC